MKARKFCLMLFVFVFNWLQESACVKVVAAVSMWDVCMEKGHKDLEQFEKVHRYVSDQLFTNFVSFYRHLLFTVGPLPGVLSNIQLLEK